MRRLIVIRVIAVAIVVALGIAAFALTRLRLPTNPPADLAAPLPAAAEADLAETMPAIDELRHRRGSLLDGTLLDDAPSPTGVADDSYVDLLRREACRLEDLAADHEDHNDFAHADELRSNADGLRQQARKLHEESELARNTFYHGYERQ